MTLADDAVKFKFEFRDAEHILVAKYTFTSWDLTGFSTSEPDQRIRADRISSPDDSMPPAAGDASLVTVEEATWATTTHTLRLTVEGYLQWKWAVEFASAVEPFALDGRWKQA